MLQAYFNPIKLLIKKTFVLLLVCMIPVISWSAEYHVGGTGADDSNDGSEGSPWATLQKAADTVVAGDTVLVHAGTYKGFEIASKSGTANNRIVFKADSGVTINENAAGIHGRDGINLENSSYITIDGFTLIGSRNSTTSRAGIRIVGEGFDVNGSFSTGVIIKNNTCSKWGIWGIFSGFSDNLLIENNTCSESAKEHGIYFSNSADNPIIRGNTIWGNSNAGIHMNSDIDTGNLAHPKVDGIIKNALVENNIIYGNGDGYSGVADNNSGGGSAINMDGVQDSLIQNNLLYDNHASGISAYRIDGAEGAKNNTIINNTIIMAEFKNGSSASRYCINITGSGSPYLASSGSIIFNNILYNLGTRGTIKVDDGSRADMKCDYNISEDHFLTVDDADAGGDQARDLTSWRSLGFGANSVIVDLSEMKALFNDYDNQDFSLATSSSAISFGVSVFNSKSAPTTDIKGVTRTVNFDAGSYEFESVIVLTVTASSGDNGSISPTGAATASSGSDLEFTFTANTGYEIDDVKVDGSSVGTSNPYLMSNITVDKTIDVSYKIKTYTLVATSSANGSISPAGSVVVNQGNDQAFTFAPDSDYEIADVLVNGTSVGTASTYTISNVTSNGTISVSYQSTLISHTIVIDVGENGAASPEGSVTVSEGGSQLFTFTPNNEFEIADVLVNGTSVGTASTYTMSDITSSGTVSVSFQPAPVAHIVTIVINENGVVSPGDMVIVNDGASQEFTITPSDGFEVSDILIDGVSVGASSSYLLENITEAKTIEAKFSEIELSTTNALLSFNFQSFDPVVDGVIVANKIQVTLEEGTDVATLIASFTHDGLSIEIDGVAQISGSTVNDYSNNLIYKIIAEDGSSQTFEIEVIVENSATTNNSSGGGGGCHYSNENEGFSFAYLFLILLSFSLYLKCTKRSAR